VSRRAVVLGVEGIIGSYLRSELLAQDWEVVGIARRPSTVSHGSYRHISVDLLDREQTFAVLAELTDISHVFAAALAWSANSANEVRDNLALLVNGVEAVESASPGLEHVCLFEGGKWYGCHTHPFKTPAYEDDPRVMPPNFYYNQQDYLTERSAEASWSWSALRPEGVGGVSIGTPHNFIQTALVYGVICRELGLPLRFPGSPQCRDALYEMTDARLLARAAIHVSTHPECHGEAFNVTNGDSFRWGQMFPFMAELLRMDYAGTQTMSLVETMADKEPLWQAAVAKYDLADHTLADLAFWPVGDGIFNQNWDNVRSTIRLRQTGFHDCIDSRQMVLDIHRELLDKRMIPDFS